jgi:hypothetical protein
MTKPFIYKGKNQPMLFCVLSFKRILSSPYLPNKSKPPKRCRSKRLKRSHEKRDHNGTAFPDYSSVMQAFGHFLLVAEDNEGTNEGAVIP